MNDSQSVPWLTGKVGEFADVRARIGWRGLSSSEYTEEGPFLIAGQHIRSGEVSWAKCDHISDKRYNESWEISLQDGDIILTKDGTIGRVARIDCLPGRATINGTMMLIRCHQGLDYRYLSHYLKGDSFRRLVEDRISGSSIPHIFQRDMIQLSIPIPSRIEQRRIAEILDKADKVIWSSEQVIAKLEQVKWGVLSDLIAREAPSWRTSNVDSEFDIKSGITLGPGRVPRNHPKPYLRVANVQRGYIDVSDVALLETSSGDSTNYALAVGDLLIVEGHANPREIGRCAIVEEGQAGLLYQNHLFRLRSRELLPEFGLLLLNSEFTRNYWWKMCATSSGLNTINSRQLRALPVPVPDEGKQAWIIELARGASSRLCAERRELDKLRLLKQGLMDDLLTGRLLVGALA